jgi:hypothetical protein
VWAISKSLGLWCGDDPAKCTIVIHIPWVTLDELGLVEICWGGANSCVIYNHRVNGYTQQSTGL